MLETSAGRILPGSFIVLTAGLKVTMGGGLSSAPTPQSMTAACDLPGPMSSMQVRALPAASDIPVLMHCSDALAPPCSWLGSPSQHCARVNSAGQFSLCAVVQLRAGLQVLAGSRPNEALKGPAGVAMPSPPGDAAGDIKAASIAWWPPQVQPCVAAGLVAVCERCLQQALQCQEGCLRAVPVSSRHEDCWSHAGHAMPAAGEGAAGSACFKCGNPGHWARDCPNG